MMYVMKNNFFVGGSGIKQKKSSSYQENFNAQASHVATDQKRLAIGISRT